MLINELIMNYVIVMNSLSIPVQDIGIGTTTDRLPFSYDTKSIVFENEGKTNRKTNAFSYDTKSIVFENDGKTKKNNYRTVAVRRRTYHPSPCVWGPTLSTTN